MKVLVTGGTGFLGRHLALKLRDLGNEVTILGRNLVHKEPLESIQFVAVDIRDTESTQAACKAQDYVFHCASLSSPWGRYQDFYDTNVLGTRHIIQGCQKHEVKRLIHVSTSSVYFQFQHQRNISESTPFPKPVNHYAKTKQLAEEEINLAHRQGFPVITIRPRAIFGEGDTSLFPRLIKASQTKGIPLINQGVAFIDLTYVSNVVDALILCQKAPDSCLGRAFNITNDQPIQFIGILENISKYLQLKFKYKPLPYLLAHQLAGGMEIIAKLTPGQPEPLLTRYTVGAITFDQTLDITAAKTELGYQPQIAVEEGLKRFCNWWKQQSNGY